MGPSWDTVSCWPIRSVTETENNNYNRFRDQTESKGASSGSPDPFHLASGVTCLTRDLLQGIRSYWTNQQQIGGSDGHGLSKCFHASVRLPIPSIPCGFGATHFWKSSVWINMRGEIDSWPRRLWSWCFSNQTGGTATARVHGRDRRGTAAARRASHECPIETATCVAGQARCQEKSCTGKLPCQPDLYPLQQSLSNGSGAPN